MPRELSSTTILVLSVFLASLADNMTIAPLLYLICLVIRPYTAYGTVTPHLEKLDQLCHRISRSQGSIDSSDGGSNACMSALHDDWDTWVS